MTYSYQPTRKYSWTLTGPLQQSTQDLSSTSFRKWVRTMQQHATTKKMLLLYLPAELQFPPKCIKKGYKILFTRSIWRICPYSSVHQFPILMTIKREIPLDTQSKLMKTSASLLKNEVTNKRVAWISTKSTSIPAKLPSQKPNEK